MGSWKQEAREKQSQIMKAHHAKKRQEKLDALAQRPKRGRGRPRKEKLVVPVPDPMKLLEQDIITSVSAMFATRDRGLHTYIRDEFNRFLRSEALSDALNVRLNEYAQKIAEAEFNRMVNIIEGQPKLTIGQRLSAAAKIIRTGK